MKRFFRRLSLIIDKLLQRITNHPFRLLLYFEWLLLSIVILVDIPWDEILPSVKPLVGSSFKPSIPNYWLLTLILIIIFGLMGLRLPTGSKNAKGYLMKDTLSDELAIAIRTVHKGYTQFAPGIIEKALDDSLKTFPTSNISEPSTRQLEEPPQLALLSAREKEVLHLIATGYSNREIAEQLYISENTVKNHVSNILYRLELRDRTQAAIFARSFLDE